MKRLLSQIDRVPGLRLSNDSSIRRDSPRSSRRTCGRGIRRSAAVAATGRDAGTADPTAGPTPAPPADGRTLLQKSIVVQSGKKSVFELLLAQQFSAQVEGVHVPVTMYLPHDENANEVIVFLDVLIMWLCCSVFVLNSTTVQLETSITIIRMRFLIFKHRKPVA